MSFWADCVKFVRSQIFRDEVVQGRTPFRFEHIELTVPPNGRYATYPLDFDPAYCIVSLSFSGGGYYPENAVVWFSHDNNSVYVAQREPLSVPVKYHVDIMYILKYEG